jgi:hypothetical protein
VTITAVRRPAPPPTSPMRDHIQIHRLLSEAPVGCHPLLEAAFAWHEHRPKGRAPKLSANPPALPERPARYKAIIVTNAFAASRLARLLSTLTWAIAAPNMQDGPTRQLRASVEVPVDEYHRVARALGAVWRGRYMQLGTDVKSDDSQHAARAVCRMAILAGGKFDHHGVSVWISTPSGLLTLTEVAGHLGLRVGAPHGPTGTTIRITADAALSCLLRDEQQACRTG